MISLSTKEPIAWPVPWASQDSPRRYFFRAGSAIDRANLEAELAGEYRAAEVYDFQLVAAFEEGARTLLKDKPEDADRLIELQQAELSLDKKSGKTMDPEKAAILAQAQEQLAENWPPYHALTARAQRRSQFIPLLCFRRFCTGWEGEGLPDYARGMDGQVDLAVTGELAPLEVRAGGAFAYALLYGAKAIDAEGNSAKNGSGPLSNVEGGPKTSPSRRARRAGLSRARSGSKTRS